MRGLIDNSVNIGGDQVITGTKTYTKNLVIDASNITLGTVPDATIYVPAFTFIDSLGRNFGGVRASYTTTKQVGIEVLAQRNETGTYYSGSGGVKLLDTGGARFSVPASQSNDSAISQSARSLASNKGYIKFGNTLIVQYIRASGTVSSYNLTVTLPTPFSTNTSYAVACSVKGTSTTSNGWNYVNSQTTTNFKVIADSDQLPVNCVAIGY